MRTLGVLCWYSQETSPRLTPTEVDNLFKTCQALADTGVLNGKFKTPSVPVFWVRISKGN
jgi:hypothetical protein